MKKRMTISIDEDVFNVLQEMPRTVSLSEVITWIVKSTFKEIKAGRELTSEELQDWMDSTPEGKDFRERLKEHWGPTVENLDAGIEKVKKSLKIKRSK